MFMCKYHLLHINIIYGHIYENIKILHKFQTVQISKYHWLQKEDISLVCEYQNINNIKCVNPNYHKYQNIININWKYIGVAVW